MWKTRPHCRRHRTISCRTRLRRCSRCPYASAKYTFELGGTKKDGDLSGSSDLRNERCSIACGDSADLVDVLAQNISHFSAAGGGELEHSNPCPRYSASSKSRC